MSDNVEKKEMEDKVPEKSETKFKNKLEELRANQRRILEELEKESGKVISEVSDDGSTGVVKVPQAGWQLRWTVLSGGSASGSKSNSIDNNDDGDDKASASSLETTPTEGGLKRKVDDEQTDVDKTPTKKTKSEEEESEINQNLTPKRDQEEEEDAESNVSEPIDEQPEEEDSEEMDDGGH